MIIQLKEGLAADRIPPRLSRDKQYLVLEIEADDFRVVDDDDDPVLYEPDLFDVIDATEPSDWVSEYGEDGERYAEPEELVKYDRYVWEKYHDGVPEAIQAVQAYLRKVGPCSWRAEPSGQRPGE